MYFRITQYPDSHHTADNLKITPMRVANVPPPMSFCDAGLRATPVDVAVSPSGKRIVALQHSGVDLIDWSYKPIKDPHVTTSITQISTPGSLRQATFVGEDAICLLGESEDGRSLLRHLELDASGKAVHEDVHTLRATSICTLKAAGELGGVLCQEQDGNVFRYSFTDKTEYPICKLPAACPWMESATLDGQVCIPHSRSRT